MPTKKIFYCQTTSLSSADNPKPAKYNNSCRLFWSNAHRRQATKYIHCVIDTFTKYVLVTWVKNKKVETVAKDIFSEWFCKFGLPIQIHTDGGKEFVNKISQELFQLLNVQHTKTNLACSQCNAQGEVLNKTVNKYLAYFVNETTLDWEN
jgi:hypothetical protein